MAEPSQRLKDLVCSWQKRRSFSVQQLREKLISHQVDNQEIQNLMEWAKQYAGVNDMALVKDKVERAKKKGLGPGRILAELAKAGFDQRDIDRGYHEGPGEEKNRANNLCEQLHRSGKTQAQIIRQMDRYGYDAQIIVDLLPKNDLN